MAYQTAYVEVAGLEELKKTFERIANDSPKEFTNLLRLEARVFRSDAIKELKASGVKTRNTKGSLSRVKAYHISKVKGAGVRRYVEIRGAAPHFHLIEHGHKLVSHKPDKNVIGQVEGYNYFDNTVKKYGGKLPPRVLKKLNAILAKEGF